MATRPNSFEGIGSADTPEEKQPVIRSGSMNSQLDKYVGHDMKVTPEKMWMKEFAGDVVRLLPLLPPESTAQLVKFLNAIPAEEKSNAAQSLIEIIEGKPVDRPMTAKDQMEILASAVDTVNKRYQGTS